MPPIYRKKVTLSLNSQNLLKVEENVVSFWHVSFRDYFCALYVSRASQSEIVKYAAVPENAAIVAFLVGMVNDPEPLVEILINNARGDNSSEARLSSVAAIAGMGTKFTTSLIRAIVPLDDIHLIEHAYYALVERSFSGDHLCTSILGRIVEQELYGYDESGYYVVLSELPASLESDAWDIVNNFERRILGALADQKVSYAEEIADELEKYLVSLTRHTNEADEYDSWLITRGFQDAVVFSEAFRKGNIKESALQEFCRNTVHYSSLPYVSFIRDYTANSQTKLEAILAVQCIERRYELTSETCDWYAGGPT